MSKSFCIECDLVAAVVSVSVAVVSVSVAVVVLLRFIERREIQPQ